MDPSHWNLNTIVIIMPALSPVYCAAPNQLQMVFNKGEYATSLIILVQYPSSKKFSWPGIHYAKLTLDQHLFHTQLSQDLALATPTLQNFLSTIASSMLVDLSPAHSIDTLSSYCIWRIDAVAYELHHNCWLQKQDDLLSTEEACLLDERSLFSRSRMRIACQPTILLHSHLCAVLLFLK